MATSPEPPLHLRASAPRLRAHGPRGLLRRRSPVPPIMLVLLLPLPAVLLLPGLSPPSVTAMGLPHAPALALSHEPARTGPWGPIAGPRLGGLPETGESPTPARLGAQGPSATYASAGVPPGSWPAPAGTLPMPRPPDPARGGVVEDPPRSSSPSPVLGPYDPSALLVPVGGARNLYPTASLWAEDGGAYVFGASFAYNVTPRTLGTVSASGLFSAGPTPGSGVVEVVALENGTSATDAVPIVVYDPVCALLTFDLPPTLLERPGTSVSATVRWLDQTGAPCAPTNALPAAWTWSPSRLGQLTLSGGGATATVRLGTAPGPEDGWLNASATTADGRNLTTSLHVSVVDSSLPTLLELSPGSAQLPEGTFLRFTTSLLNGAGLPPGGNTSWTLFPTTLGSLVPSGTVASFTAGPRIGSGWVNATYSVAGGGVLSVAAPLQVLLPPSAPRLAGASVPVPSVGPLFPSEGTSLLVEPTDQWGGRYTGPVNVTWAVTPAGLGSVVGNGTQVVFVAGAHPGNGSVIATLNATGAPAVLVPFHLDVVPDGLSSVTLFGGPSDHVKAGGVAFLEGVDQDLFGNLLLAGGYYGLHYPGMQVAWTLCPSDLGTLVPVGNGTPSDLPEEAVFTAGPVAGSGMAFENISWDGRRMPLTFPLVVDLPHPHALEVALPAPSTPFGGVAENLSVGLTALLLDQDGHPTSAGGNVTWNLDLGSDATGAGAPFGSSWALRTGRVPGVVHGTVTWRAPVGGGVGANASATAAFFFSVVGPSNASFVTVVPGGRSAAVDTSLSQGEIEGPVLGGSLLPGGDAFVAGTTSVPGASGPPSWTLVPATLGSLSNPVGVETNVTLTAGIGTGWLNVTFPGPGGAPFVASVPLATYLPRLAGLQQLTGPCVAYCAPGLATYAGDNAYVGLAPVDQLGRPYTGAVAWTTSTDPGDLGSATVAPWSFGAGAVLVAWSANATIGNGTLTVRATASGADSAFTLPLVVVAAPVPLGPSPVTGLTATPGEGSVDLTWSPPALAGAGQVVNYTVEVHPGYVRAWENHSMGGAPASPRWTFLGLRPGTVYTFRVRAWNTLGLAGPWSAWVSAVPTAPPLTNGTAGVDLRIAGIVLLPAALLGGAVAALVLQVERKRRAARRAARRRARRARAGGPTASAQRTETRGSVAASRGDPTGGSRLGETTPHPAQGEEKAGAVGPPRPGGPL